MSSTGVGDIEDAFREYGLKDGLETRDALLGWWDEGHRSMPWRREPPYAGLSAA